MVRGSHLWYSLLASLCAIALQWAPIGPIGHFIAAGLAIIPLASLMGRATEELAASLGPRFGGLLNASFGNAAELILGLAALRQGMLAVVRASIIGSIIGNALFVLGLSLLVGGLRHGRQSFDRIQVGLQSTLLVLAAIGITIPSVLYRELGPRAEVTLSEEVAVILALTYVLSLIFSLWTRQPGEAASHSSAPGGQSQSWKPWFAGAGLAVATALVAVLSEFLVHALDEAQQSGALESLGMTPLFVGVIIVAIIGNAAEHSTAVLMAYRNHVDLTLEIAVGSSLQIALFVMPVLVFASLVIAPEPLDLRFTLLELLALGASVAALHLVAADGQSHWMEGVLLLAVYIILALAFYHLTDNGMSTGQPPNHVGSAWNSLSC